MFTSSINYAAKRAFAAAIVLSLIISMLPFTAAAQADEAAPAPVCAIVVASNDDGDVPTENGVQTFVHSAWTDEITGAQWLWSDEFVTDTTVNQVRTFTQTFIWGGDEITNIDFQFASDNGYVVSLNGDEVASETATVEPATDFHSGVTQLTIDPADIIVGENELTFEITNLGTPGNEDPEANPAGFIFKMIIDGEGTGCDVLPPVTGELRVEKVVVGDGEATADDFFFSVRGVETETEPLTQRFEEDGSNTVELEVGTYDVTEVDIPANYTATYSESCDNVVVSEEGETPVCLITNTYTAPDGGGEGGGDKLPVCETENLLTNGSFEVDEVAEVNGAFGGFYQVFETIAGWTSTAGFELWKNMAGGASDGEQNAELDVDVPTTITQPVATVVGQNYLLTYDYAARPGTASLNNLIHVIVDGEVVDSQLVDGEAGDIDWNSFSYEFEAASTTTTIEFKDASIVSDGLGTLLDNVSLCGTEEEVVVVDTYEIFGFVYEDEDEDDTLEEGEDRLNNWTVTATEQGTEGEPRVFTTETDENGRYSLFVPAGTWKISQVVEDDYEQISEADVDGSYIVTVPVIVEVEVSFLDWLLPTAHAADFAEYVGPKNFGNEFTGSNGGGTRTGSRPSRGGSTPGGSVLGAATSTPTVLGDATSVMPVGAPNTGAGGTAPVATSLPTLLAVLTTAVATRKTK